MKITSLLSSGVLEFNDLGSYIKGVSPILRDIKLNAGASKYLLDTTEVLLSYQAGDIHRFLAANKISINDTATLSNGGSIVITHNLGVIPRVQVINNTTPTAPAVVLSGITIVHNAALTTTTVTSSLGSSQALIICIG